MRRKTQIRQMPDKNETRGGIGQPSVHYTESILALAVKKVKQNSQKCGQEFFCGGQRYPRYDNKKAPLCKGSCQRS